MTLVEKYKDGGGLVKHALSEFRYAGWMDADGRFNDEAQEMMCDCVLSLLLNMEGQGHSGVSAGYLISLFKSLANFEVISPLKGTDDEWGEVSTLPTRQGKTGGISECSSAETVLRILLKGAFLRKRIQAAVLQISQAARLSLSRASRKLSITSWKLTTLLPTNCAAS